MKTELCAIGAVLSLGLVAYLHYFSKPEPPPVVVAPVVKPPPKPVSDKYFLVSYYSTTTATGVIGWTPGQMVQLSGNLHREDGKIAVTDGKYIAVLPPSMLTQDERLAIRLSRLDEAAQVQSSMIAAAERAKIAEREMAVCISSAALRAEAEAQRIASSTIGAAHNRLNDPAYPAAGATGLAYGYHYGTIPYYPASNPYPVYSYPGLSEDASVSAPTSNIVSPSSRFGGDHYSPSFGREGLRLAH